jgi:5-methylcytosine-specific restriction endonuclease McrA
MTIKHNPKSKILGEHPLDEVLTVAMREKHNRHMVINGRKYSTTRMKVFGLHGCKCVRCGLEGTKVILTQDAGGGLHLDLYAEGKGGYTLLNRDHILPASMSGKDHVWNMRPMCAPCNTKRGNHYTKEDRKLFNYRENMRVFYYRLRKRKVSHKWSYRISGWLAHILP